MLVDHRATLEPRRQPLHTVLDASAQKGMVAIGPVAPRPFGWRFIRGKPMSQDGPVDERGGGV
jgi:hypothetical protein